MNEANKKELNNNQKNIEEVIKKLFEEVYSLYKKEIYTYEITSAFIVNYLKASLIGIDEQVINATALSILAEMPAFLAQRISIDAAIRYQASAHLASLKYNTKNTISLEKFLKTQQSNAKFLLENGMKAEDETFINNIVSGNFDHSVISKMFDMQHDGQGNFKLKDNSKLDV